MSRIGQNDSRPSLGAPEAPARPGLTAPDIAALVLSVVWLLGALVFFFVSDPAEGVEAGVDPFRFIMVLMAVFLPVGVLWVAATSARAARTMREESRRLSAAVDALRETYVAQTQRPGTARSDDSVAKKLEEIAVAQRKTEVALAMFTSTRDPQVMRRPAPKPPAAGEDDQAPLPLGTRASDLQEPIAKSDFIRAMNFPETADDEEGFAALRKALRDRQSALVIQAAQDVLTLVSQDGIYMDDLRPDPARPEIWRKFAAGERGRQVAALGGIRDRSSLALVAGRMKQDPIFRDAAHHFLRHFDRMFVEFEKTASDEDIQRLSDTRTSRAFMLLGRVAGIFD